MPKALRGAVARGARAHGRARKNAVRSGRALVAQSEEDQLLKSQLEQLVQTLQDADTALHLAALEQLRTLIRTSTSSMTSVPKPLKFLRPHYEALVKRYDELTDAQAKVR